MKLFLEFTGDRLEKLAQLASNANITMQQVVQNAVEGLGVTAVPVVLSGGVARVAQKSGEIDQDRVREKIGVNAGPKKKVGPTKNLKCSHCGRGFRRETWRVNWSQKKGVSKFFCSVKCRGEALAKAYPHGGKKVSKEEK